MNSVKRRISIMLCMILVFTAAFCIVPAEQLQAANELHMYTMLSGEKAAEVQKNAKDLYIGDYITACYYDAAKNGYQDLGYLSNLSGVTYSSSNQKIIQVDKKTGKAQAKKNGTATVTAKYKGKKMKIKMKVVSSSTIKKVQGKIDDYKPKREEALAFLKTVGKADVNKSNRYQMLKALGEYREQLFGYEGIYSVDNDDYQISKTTIYDSQMGHAAAVAGKIAVYAEKFNPVSTRSGKCFKVKSISGKANSKEIKIKLKANVTKDQMFGLNYAKMIDNGFSVSEAKTYQYPAIVVDEKTDQFYWGTATVKQGKNYITFKMNDLKLKKGRTYSLVDYEGGWLKEQKHTFKAK